MIARKAATRVSTENMNSFEENILVELKKIPMEEAQNSVLRAR